MKNSAPDALLSQRSLATPPSPSESVSRAGTRVSTSTRRSAPTIATPDSQTLTGQRAEKAAEKAKKRVRLKPETREQLLERLRNPPLSLHETSILLRVSRATVRRYADAGRLPCLRTPGGQRRFALRDIETFYRQLKTKR